MNPHNIPPEDYVSPLERRVMSLLWECSGPNHENCIDCRLMTRCKALFDNLPRNINQDDYDTFLMKFTSIKRDKKSVNHLMEG